MRRTLSTFLGVLVLVAWGTAVRRTASPAERADLMPPEPAKIEAALVARGLIPANANAATRAEAVRAYMQLKMQSGEPDAEGNPLARKRLNAREEALNGRDTATLRGRKLGNTVSVPASSPQFKPLQSSDKLLVILVDFSDTPYTWTPSGQAPKTAAGPLHNYIPVPDNSFDLWVPDFSREHYENMLFTTGGWSFPAGTPRYAGEHRGSMRDYMLEQSYGKYTISGQAYGWFTVGKPEAYYGDDNPNGGSDNLSPGTPATLVSDVVNVIPPGTINWLEYDQKDPYDLDGDLDVNEPDCIIDHPLFIHAGVDQSGGGGAQGDDALWARSTSTSKWVTTEKNPGAVCPASWPGTRIYNFTIMPEDGGIGVFAHEFGHDLGLPDEYDTAASGGNATGFWSLMSSGSWIGQPAQTQPPGMSIWGRYSLNWLGDAIGTTSLDALGAMQQFRLEQAERWGGSTTLNAIRVALPDKRIPVNTPHSGSYEWFGGRANEIDTSLQRTIDLTGKTSATLSFWTWYDIEQSWDFGFVQVSTNGGGTWVSLPIEGTTDVIDPAGYPAIAANLPGFTGSSGGWVHKTFDLSTYAGQSIMLQFRYMTDWGTINPGFFVDDISVTAGASTIFFDDVETIDGAWTANGWTRDPGFIPYTHYYMLEWRNLANMETAFDGGTIVNFDAGLRNAYSHDPYAANPNEPYYFSYSPGLLLWYRDTTYTDNWTGLHNGGGFLLVVDAHKKPLMMPPFPDYGAWPWNYRIQTYDSAFSLLPAPPIEIGYFGMRRNYSGFSAVPNFDDGQSYWNQLTPTSSVITPRYGLTFRVLGQASDGSAAVIGMGRKVGR